jgi:transposase
MNKKRYTYYAVDVAKESLQTQTDEREAELEYNRKGIRAIIQYVRKHPDMVVVMEATGGHERQLLDALHTAEVPCIRINPARVRAFANSEGVKAKTDRIDACMLLRFAREKKLQPKPAPTAEEKHLAALMDRRSQLSGMLTEEKNRLQNSPSCIHADIRSLIRTLETKILRLEKRIQDLIKSTESFRKKTDLIQSVKGVGWVSAVSILAYLPEITQVSRNQLAALAGVAPFNRDSGNKTGKRYIGGGRAKVRHPLYMAALSASKHNPVIRAYVEGLRSRGKPFKCANIAAMRKLLIHIQSILRKHDFAA